MFSETLACLYQYIQHYITKSLSLYQVCSDNLNVCKNV